MLTLVNELGLTVAGTGRQPGLTPSGVAQIPRRSQYLQLVDNVPCARKLIAHGSKKNHRL
jgi:hypothetical protein